MVNTRMWRSPEPIRPLKRASCTILCFSLIALFGTDKRDVVEVNHLLVFLGVAYRQ